MLPRTTRAETINKWLRLITMELWIAKKKKKKKGRKKKGFILMNIWEILDLSMKTN